MLLISITFWQLVLIGVGVGVVLGLIPLILGFAKGKRNLALYGFVASIIGGALSSIISLAVVIVFIWLILKKPTAANDVVAYDNAAETDTDITVNR